MQYIAGERGLKIDKMVVSGRSSSDANAAYIAEAINNLDLGEDEKLVLVGHSKGAVDILHCLVNFPQAVRHVAAVVSVAGAINGSPLAAKMKTIFTTGWPGICCRLDAIPETTGRLTALRPAIRLNWMAANPLPRIGEILFTGVSYQPRSRQHAVENRLRAALDLQSEK
jgi:pimeloyl-ACP methyl ester carboxylesterase